MSKWCRYEILLPLKFNDGQPVPDALIIQTLLELEQQFEAVSWESPDHSRRVETSRPTLSRRALSRVRRCARQAGAPKIFRRIERPVEIPLPATRRLDDDLPD